MDLRVLPRLVVFGYGIVLNLFVGFSLFHL